MFLPPSNTRKMSELEDASDQRMYEEVRTVGKYKEDVTYEESS